MSCRSGTNALSIFDPSFPHKGLAPSRTSPKLRLVHRRNMAYPFPRSVTGPQTPEHVSDVKFLLMPRGNNSTLLASKRTALAVFVAIALFLWMISPYSGSSRQTDMIPFSHDAIDECAARHLLPATALTFTATSVNLKVIKNAASHLRISTFHQARPMRTVQSILCTATIVQGF